MKFIVPLAFVVFLAACVTSPQDKEAAHQAQLEKEARENFYALRAQSGANPAPPPTPTPAPKRSWFAFGWSRPAPADAEQPPKPAPRKPDDTVYFWQVPPPSQTIAIKFTRAEIRYARELAKKPEQLTPEERLWAREHY